MSVSLVLGSLVLLLWLGFLARRYMHFLYLAAKFPGPSLWQIVLGAKECLGDYFVFHVQKYCIAYNNRPWGLWTMRGFVVFVSDCDSVQYVLTSKAFNSKPNLVYKQIAFYLGKNLLSLDVEQHKYHRKLLGPAYRKGVVGAHLQQINILAKGLTDELRQVANGEDVDTRSLMRKHTGNMSIYFYSRSHLSDERVKEMISVLEEAMYEVRLSAINPAYYYLWHRLKRSTREREKRVRAVLADRKHILAEMKTCLTERMGNSNDNKPTCPLDVIITKKAITGEDVIDDEAMVSEMSLLISAGQDTTSFTINMCLVLIALHPEVQERIFEEVDAIFGGSMRPVEHDDRAQLKFLEMAIMETLRLFPTIPILGRKADQEVVLGGATVPKGSTVIVDIFALHRNPEVYEDPLKYDPTRFSAASSQGKHSYAFIPFGAGRRNCIGEEQASVTIMTSLCHIFREFQVLPGTGIKSIDDIMPVMNVSFHFPKCPLRFVKRNT